MTPNAAAAEAAEMQLKEVVDGGTPPNIYVGEALFTSCVD